MKKLIIEIDDEVYKTVQDGTYCGSLYEELKAARPYEPSSEDLISRSVAINLLNEAQVEFDEYYKGLGKAKTIIDNAQAVEPEKGEWSRHDEWRGGEYIGGFYHVNCPCEDGYYSKWETNFCPNCGLPMKKGDPE